MAKNERNAGRKPKYAHKSKTISFSVPEDVINEVKENVRETVKNKAKKFGEPIENINSSIVTPYNESDFTISVVTEKKIKDLWAKAEFPCGCSIENNLLKRGKGKCKLSKEEHLKNH